MVTRLVPWLTIAATALALAACNNGSNTPPSPPKPCPTPTGDTTVLVYPAPGATSVPGTFGQVIVASTIALPSGYDVLVTDAVNPNGVLGAPFTTASPPFPTPNATPPFANPQYQSSAFNGVFASGQGVTVYINDPGSNCAPVGPVGTFST